MDYVNESIYETRSVEELLDQPRTEWAIEGVAAVNGTVVLHAPPAHAKTTLMLCATVAVALGRPFFGRRVARGGVLFIGGEGALRERVAAQLTREGVSIESLRAVRFMDAAPNLTEAEVPAEFQRSVDRAVADIGQALQEQHIIDGIILIVLDPMINSMTGADENSSAAMTRLFDNAVKAFAKVPRRVLVLVGHSGKDKARGLRGHSSVSGKVDAEIRISSEHGGFKVEAVKNRDGRPGEIGTFKLKLVSLVSASSAASWSQMSSACIVEETATTPICAGAGAPADAPSGSSGASENLLRELLGIANRMLAAAPDGVDCKTLRQAFIEHRLGEKHGTAPYRAGEGAAARAYRQGLTALCTQGVLHADKTKVTSAVRPQ